MTTILLAEPLTTNESWRAYPCIAWTGTVMNQGYGKLTDQRLAHRVAFENHYGYVPKEPRVVDHKCRNRLCVEPRHLQDITRAENTRLGSVRKGKSPSCKQCGLMRWGYRSNGYRYCLDCAVIRARKNNATS